MRGSVWEPCALSLAPYHILYLLFLGPCLRRCLHTVFHAGLPVPPEEACGFVSEISKGIPSGFHLILRIGFCEKTKSRGFCLGLSGKASERRRWLNWALKAM